jgi:heat shock protein HtpX
MFAILYGIIAGLGYLLGLSGADFFIYLAGFAAFLVFIQYMIGPKAVEWSMRVRYVDENEYPKLHKMVAELAKKAGIPKPRVGVSELNIPNAFAFGRTKNDARVCVTKRILKILSDDELKAVLGHEISHVKHKDVVVITMLSVVPMICYMIYISFFWSGMLYGRRGREAGATILVGLAALVLYFITSLLVMYGSRIREYYADMGSVQLGNHPSKLATALYKLVYGNAKADKKHIVEAAGSKAFFINDPSRAVYEIRELSEIDVDMSGTIDPDELNMLRQRKIKLSTADKILELLSTHPNMLKRIKHLASLNKEQ